MEKEKLEKAIDAIEGSKRINESYIGGNWSIAWKFENFSLEMNSYSHNLHVMSKKQGIFSCTPFSNVEGIKKEGKKLLIMNVIDATYKLDL